MPQVPEQFVEVVTVASQGRVGAICGADQRTVLLAYGVLVPQLTALTVQVIHTVLQERTSLYLEVIVVDLVPRCGRDRGGDSGGAPGTQSTTLRRSRAAGSTPDC